MIAPATTCTAGGPGIADALVGGAAALTVKVNAAVDRMGIGGLHVPPDVDLPPARTLRA